MDFSELLTPEMKIRKKQGYLEWMDKVEVFEGMYIPACVNEGRERIKGKSDDRFVATWKIYGMTIKGESGDDWWTVVETYKKSPK